MESIPHRKISPHFYAQGPEGGPFVVEAEAGGEDGSAIRFGMRGQSFRGDLIRYTEVRHGSQVHKCRCNGTNVPLSEKGRETEPVVFLIAVAIRRRRLCNPAKHVGHKGEFTFVIACFDAGFEAALPPMAAPR